MCVLCVINIIYKHGMSKHGFLPRFREGKHLHTTDITCDTLTVNGQAITLASPESQIIVTQASIDDGLFDGEIDSTKVYTIDGNLDISGYQITVPAAGLQMHGFGFDISSLSSSDNQPMFISPGGGSGNVLMQEMALSATGASGSVFALTDATGFNAVEFERVNFNNCTDLGYFDGYRQGLESGTGRFGGTPSLEFRGTWLGGYFITTSIARSLTDSVYSIYKCAVGQTFASRLGGNPNILVPANVTVFEVTPANFVEDELFQLDGANFQGDGTVLSGITEADKEARVQNTKGITNTFVGIYWKCTSVVQNNLIGTAAAPAGLKDPVLLSGTTVSVDQVWFSQTGNNSVTCLTSETINVKGIFNGSFYTGSNQVKEFTIHVCHYKDSDMSDNIIASTTFSTNTQGRAESVAIFTPRIQMTVNDRLEVLIQTTETSNEDITMQKDSHFLVQEQVT